VLVNYPSEEEEFVIVQRVTGHVHEVVPVASTEQLMALQKQCRATYVEPALVQHAVRLSAATRDPERFGIKGLQKYITYGASPRASIWLIEGSRALAFLRGRDYVVPQDVTDLVADVFRHRLVLSYEALSEGLAADDLIAKIMAVIRAPEKPMEAHVQLQS
jgi:MoxR-like ATPase